MAQVDVEYTGEVDEKGRKLAIYKGWLVREVANGALQRVDNGYLVSAPDEKHRLEPMRSSESARELNYIRWHGKREAALRDAVNEHLNDGTIRDIDTADAEVAKILMAEVVLNPKVRGKDRVDAWLAILEQSGMDGRAPKGAKDDANSAQMTSIMTGAVGALLYKLTTELENRPKPAQSREVIDAE